MLPAHHSPFLVASLAAPAIPPSRDHCARDTARAARATNVSSHLAALPTQPARTRKRQPVAPGPHVTTSPTPGASHPPPTHSASPPLLIRIPITSYRVRAGLAPALVFYLRADRAAPALVFLRAGRVAPARLSSFHSS